MTTASHEGNSRRVFSTQTEAHPDLPVRLERHLASPFLKPVLDYNRQAFALAMQAWKDRNPESPLLLDAGCGTGESALRLAQRYPDHFVFGVDQSADRLGRQKTQALPDNLCLVRADLVDFWRLLAEQKVRLSKHFMLYPNPWPKKKHLGRRWHGHPVFPVCLALGGELECRSNWRVYIEEMAWALSRLSGQSVLQEDWLPEQPLTPFEHKYQRSGHGLWRCRVDLR